MTVRTTVLRRLGAAGLLACAAMASAGATVPTLPAYNSFGGAPYVMGRHGLAPELVAYLNRKLAGQYRFTLRTLPRRELNQIMDGPQGFAGVALLLAPEFSADTRQKRYLWSAPFMADSNVIISRLDNPVRYDGPASLQGLRFAGIFGNRYPGVDEYIGKGIQRANAPDALANLRKLVHGEADFTIVPLSAYRFLRGQMGRQGLSIGQLHVAERPHRQFSRHFVVDRANPALGAALERLARSMPCDPEWRGIAQRYHFTAQPDCR